MKKKAFTLLEVTISITLFMIVIVFLYKSLDQSKYSNDKFAQKQEKLINNNSLNNIFLEDFAESIGNINIKQFDDKKTIVKFKSNNTYHNAFLNNITYLIGSNDTFIRIESKEEFKESDTLLDFYENAYIDVLLKDVELFEIKNNQNEYVLILKQKNQQRKVFKVFKLRD